MLTQLSHHCSIHSRITSSSSSTTTSIIDMDRMDYHHHHLGNVAAVASRLYQPEEEDDSSIENTKPSSSNSKGGSLAPGTNTGRWSNEEHQRVSSLLYTSRMCYSLSFMTLTRCALFYYYYYLLAVVVLGRSRTIWDWQLEEDYRTSRDSKLYSSANPRPKIFPCSAKTGRRIFHACGIQAQETKGRQQQS